MRTQHFDVVVVGHTPGAAAVAAQLGKRGVRGLIVEQGEGAPGLGDLGFLEPRAPALDAVVQAVGLAHDLERDRRVLKPAHLQVVYADRRIELSGERALLEREAARRLAAGALPAFERLLGRLEALEPETTAYLAEVGELPPPGFFARRAAAGVAKKWPSAVSDARAWSDDAGELGAAVAALLPFVSYQDPSDELPTLAWARLAGRVLRGLMPWSTRSLRDRMLEQAERNGFERARGTIEALVPDAKPIRFTTGGQSLTADVLVDASAELGGLHAVEARTKALDELLEEARPSGRVHTLSIELDRAAVPPPLGEHVLLVNGRLGERRRESEDRPILLLAQKTSQARARFVVAHPLDRAADAAGLERAMRGRLERLIPFLPRANPVFEAAPMRPHPLFPPHEEAPRIARVSPRTPFKSVFVGGPAVLPGLGVEGELIGALKVAELALERLGKKS